MAAKAPAFRDFKKVSRERGLFKWLRSSQSLISTCGKVNKTAVGRRGGAKRDQICQDVIVLAALNPAKEAERGRLPST